MAVTTDQVSDGGGSGSTQGAEGQVGGLPRQGNFGGDGGLMWGRGGGGSNCREEVAVSHPPVCNEWLFSTLKFADCVT